MLAQYQTSTRGPKVIQHPIELQWLMSLFVFIALPLLPKGCFVYLCTYGPLAATITQNQTAKMGETDIDYFVVVDVLRPVDS